MTGLRPAINGQLLAGRDSEVSSANLAGCYWLHAPASGIVIHEAGNLVQVRHARLAEDVDRLADVVHRHAKALDTADADRLQRKGARAPSSVTTHHTQSRRSCWQCQALFGILVVPHCGSRLRRNALAGCAFCLGGARCAEAGALGRVPARGLCQP